ncbi:MAG: helix-turn-helix transcriptional regulator [Planctomycetes bacterium]|nr:helix-turn-helix transcriptional regulator [Planctomycetota bacterium]
MDPRTLHAYLKAAKLTPSDLARRIGVSPQIVSSWIQKDGPAHLPEDDLSALSRALGVNAEDLERPLPCFDTDEHNRLHARYLWDRLYPDLDDFAIGLNHLEPRAVARLVEVDGLYAAARILGEAAWDRFTSYKRFLPPARRRQLETLHAWRSNQTAA